MVDAKRIVPLHRGSDRPGAEFVLYWMQIQRRSICNDALNLAVEQANRRGLPVLVYEGLRHDYPHASDRIHTFVLENARELSRSLAGRGIRHAFYLERNASDRRKIVKRLARRAALVVTDDYPAFLVPGHNRALARIAKELDVPAAAVDSCGVVPLREFQKREYAARTIRPKIEKLLPFLLVPRRDPRVERDGKKVDPGFREVDWKDPVPDLVASCAVDHEVAAVGDLVRGGRAAALSRLRTFVEERLSRYGKERNEPAAAATSGLSPYLHFGMISPLEVALRVREAAGAGDPNVRAFLEELIVRRELSFNFCHFEPRHNSLASLPDWARKTLAEHDGDEREHVYRRRQFEEARTHDELWNACQDEIRFGGTMHNYVRMLWGKKIIEWSPSHASALRTMTHLNDKYGLDGRDPNSYTSFLWCFGLHDRAWGERPVFGKIRYMSSASMRRKVDAERYIASVAALRREREEAAA